MIVIDIGNTNTVLGIFLNKKLLKKSRITSTNIKNFEKNLAIFFNSNFKLLKKSKTKICLLSSVVPKLNNLVKKITLKYDIIFFNLNSKNLPFKLNIKYDLKKIGADRLANTIAIINLKYKNSIIVDFGTATTFDVIKNNTYVGGLIFPGISISHNSLIKSAALLKKIKFVKIKKIVAMGANLRPDETAVNSWAINEAKGALEFVSFKAAQKDTSKNWPLGKQVLGLLVYQPNIPKENLSKITAKVLIIAGDKDVIKNQHSVEIFEHIPNAHLCIMPGQTHFATAENATYFNGIVDTFLSQPFSRPDSDWTKKRK